MSWQGKSIITLRSLINDTVEETYTYTDERLEHSILVAGFLLLRQISFSQEYVVNVEECTISPDPESDYDFLALIALRAAILILSGELKTHGLQAVIVSDGPSSVDMRSIAGYIKMLLADAVKTFEEAKLAQQIGNGGYGQAILSPYGYSGYNFRQYPLEKFR
jgi:hypothetical protein